MLANARDPEQRKKMVELKLSGRCLFCCGDWPTFYETEHWIVGHNQYPYSGTNLHVLIVPRYHTNDLIYLPHEVKDDFWSALRFNEDGQEAYSLGVRCGNTAKTGGTLEHVHWHYVVADGSQAVRFKMGGSYNSTK